MLRVLPLFAFIAAASPAFGQTAASLTVATPSLRPAVTVSSDLVRIGDLVENAGPAAQVAIFRAPDLGETGSVPVQRVLEALRPHAVIGVNAGGISEVTVTRASRTIRPEDIEARIVQALLGQNAQDAGSVTVTLDREPGPIALDAAATGDIAVTRTSFDIRSGRFDVTVELPGGGVSRKKFIRLTGTAIETADSVTVLRPLARGEILRSSDVAVEKRPRSVVGKDAVGDPRQAIGQAARQPLRGGHMLRQSDLMKPELVQRNDIVVISYAAPGILLTVRGKAIDAGGEGDTVNVLNLQSKRTLQGIVTGPGRVAVGAQGLLSSSNLASVTNVENRAE